MNPWIPWLNEAGAAWVGWAWASAVQSSLLVLGVLAASRALRRRANPAVHQALWMLVLVKLMLPPTWGLPIALGYWVPRGEGLRFAAKAGESTGRGRWVEPESDRYGLFTGRATEAVSSGGGVDEVGLSWQAGLALSALAGMGILLAAVARAGIRLRREVRCSSPAGEDWRETAIACAASLGLKRVPEVRWTTGLASPAVCGLGRPVILVPRRLAERLDPEARRDVLLHEMAHVRRADLWCGTVEVLLLAVYWWHPLVWLVRSRRQRIREEIADATAIVDGQRDAGRYAETLLSVARSAAGRPWLALGLMGILESRSLLRGRIEAVLGETGVRPPRLGWRNGTSLAVLGLLVLPMAEGHRRASAGEAPGTLASELVTLGAPPTVFRHGTPEELAAARSARFRERSDSYRTERVGFPDYHVSLGSPTDAGRWPMVELGRMPGIPGAPTLRPRSAFDPGAGWGDGKRSSRVAGVALEPAVEAGEVWGEGYAVEARYEAVPSGSPWVARQFRLPFDRLIPGLEALLGKPLEDTADAWTAALREAFRQAGVTFEPPATMWLQLRTGVLSVWADPAALSIVEKTLDALTPVPPMIQIEARFVRVTHPGLRGLWGLREGVPEVLEEAAFREVRERVGELEPEPNRWVGPRVTTLGGRGARIEQTEAGSGSRPDGGGVAGERLVLGLDVIPEVAADGRSMVLWFGANFRGFSGDVAGGGQVEGVRREVGGYSARAAPRVRSGETVMVRLAKAEGAGAGEDDGRPVAVVVFVTATFIDPAGNVLERVPGK